MLALLHLAGLFVSLLLALAFTPRVVASIFGNSTLNSKMAWYWASSVAAFITLKFLV